MNSLLGQPDLARDLAAVIGAQRVAEARARALARRAVRENRDDRALARGGHRDGREPDVRLVWRPARLRLERP